jgi:hypothetical protein
VLAVLCATSVVLGWYQGYTRASANLTCRLFTTLTLLIGRNVVSRLFTPAPMLETLVRLAVVAFVVVVACGLALGLVGRLTTSAYLAADVTFLLATLFSPRP